MSAHTCYTPGIYAEGYIVFVFPFVGSSVCMFVRSYFRHVCRICVKVLLQSFSSGVYLSNYLQESIHIYTPGIYAEGYIVFVFPFVRSSVCMFVCSSFRHVCRICVKVLRQSFSSGVYLGNYLPESIHIWTIVTLEG